MRQSGAIVSRMNERNYPDRWILSRVSNSNDCISFQGEPQITPELVTTTKEFVKLMQFIPLPTVPHIGISLCNYVVHSRL